MAIISVGESIFVSRECFQKTRDFLRSHTAIPAEVGTTIAVIVTWGKLATSNGLTES